MPRHLRHERHRRYVRHDRHDPFASVTTVGQVQYSANGTTGWANAIPGGTMKVNTDLSFYVRVNPANLDLPDDGSYEYRFAMATVGAAGLTLVNGSGDARNTAKIAGKTPTDQLGLLFSVNCTVVDKRGNASAGTALTQTWVAAS